ncbi:ATP-grasp domain-containing protein [Methanolobus halotolerans]|uniref:D-alanine--D-alanine ligase n=1 Tax=Methanolobus halotolerans TaxID=2052935 RepID=A0A4E0PZ22_9EURY|nr:ATP-grasp domain-containing protein [Methanolobus halotolerans]TGC09100.1 D-alanine--D-alanine ligase [Methanolobus halotolerans]
MKMKMNVFIVGMDRFNLKKLQRVPEAEECEFHAALYIDEIRNISQYDMDALIDKAEQRIKSTPGGIHAIVSYFDFPATDLIPILAEKFGVPGPDLECILKCQHKYWSRYEQKKIIPGHIPEFCPFDPFEDDPFSSINLELPFWIKPFRSFRSFLAFKITTKEQFYEYIDEIRENVSYIHEPFLYILKVHEIPDEIANMKESCIAEKPISGHQCTLEGYVFNKKVVIYGIVDSIKDQYFFSFLRYEYPSCLPDEVQNRMVDVCSRFIKHIGLDNSAFNVEFFYNQANDEVYLLEINSRISQSHADLFEKVHGMSHHRVMLQIALGREPDPLGQNGEFRYAAKFMYRTFEAGKVQRVPSEEEIDEVIKEIPGTIIKTRVVEGQRLSELQMQDSYSYELADIFVGAQNRDELVDKYNYILERIPFSIERKN